MAVNRRGFIDVILSIVLATSWSSADPLPKSNAPVHAKCITKNDFVRGTLILNQSGVYRLCEDIEFKPTPYNTKSNMSPLDAFVPNFDDGTYDRNEYGMGFFSAISIATDNVDLYLDGHTLEQSPEHALLQRFFALIELASSPFLPKVGPHDFGDGFVPATDVKILGPGTLGRSSHHGIHGNENSNIVVRDITFEDFEVGAVSLNNIDDLIIEGCKIEKNRHNVPVIGMWSAALFIRYVHVNIFSYNTMRMINQQRVASPPLETA